MKLKKLIPNAPVKTVKANTPIGECIGLLRDKNLGALIVVSGDARERIVGIFTERDLVKNIELIRRGAFWDTPVRAVMTSAPHTITVNELARAPELMAKHHIRHLPVVAEEKGQTRIVGLISMRDLFRLVMEELDYDLGKAFAPAAGPGKKEKTFVGIFSPDSALIKVVDEASKLSPRCVVKAARYKGGLSEYFESFAALLVDIDGMGATELGKLFSECRAKKKNQVFLVFSPALLADSVRENLHKLDSGGHVTLIAKPIALGLLYEKFIKAL